LGLKNGEKCVKLEKERFHQFSFHSSIQTYLSHTSTHAHKILPKVTLTLSQYSAENIEYFLNICYSTYILKYGLDEREFEIK